MTDIEIHVSIFPEAWKTWKHAFLSFLADLQFDFYFMEQDVEYQQGYHRKKRSKIWGNSLTSVWIRNGCTINQRNIIV